jgi:NAD-dependent SIR2 family protein deacetylase
LRHKADATAKYGRRAKSCRAAHVKQEKGDSLKLHVDSYKGGIALWGAVPPVYDTTELPLDRGIHVHARESVNSRKHIDATYSSVRMIGSQLPRRGLTVSAIDAIYYMVSSVFGFEMKQVLCSHCGAAHLDRDWFSVHPHGRHLCASCGNTFSDNVRSIGNPICGLREVFGVRPHKTKSANRSINIRQEDYPGGIQIWGSNPALIWTGMSAEEEGIHLHAFASDETEPTIDDTYSEVTIDGVRLDPLMVRVLMAQNTLPHLAGRIMSVPCKTCGQELFSTGENAFSPAARHTCPRCGDSSQPVSRFRKTIANPLPHLLAGLAGKAPRRPREVLLDLLPETPH